MPTNSYSCDKCSKTWTYIGPRSDRECPECGALTSPQLPRNICAPSVFEVVDKSRNVKWRENFQEKAEQRNKNYQKKVGKETARVHGDDPSKHGITEDDGKLV